MQRAGGASPQIADERRAAVEALTSIGRSSKADARIPLDLDNLERLAKKARRRKAIGR